MGRQVSEEYIAVEEAMRLLNICSKTVELWTKRGLLRPQYFERDRRRYFRQDEVMALAASREDKRTDLLQIQTTALAALSAARRAEERIESLYKHMGLSVVPLQREPDAVRALYAEAQKPFTEEQLYDAGWLHYWGGSFFSMDEVYLELVGLIVESEEPWKAFMDFSNQVVVRFTNRPKQALEESFRYFEAGRRHLRYAGYHLCRSYHGGRTVEKIFQKKARAVDELFALIH